ncbi:AMP-binding protein [Microbacterium algeriense]|nr:AMP-binding protein [Microbacterium algeriense]
MTSNSDLALAEFFRAGGLDPDLMLVDYVFTWASRHPRRAALVDDAGQVSYEELAADILRMADALRGLGLVPGDYISIALPNCREWVVAHLAGMLIGLVTNPILLIHRERGIAQALSSVQSRILITVDSYRGFDYVDAVLRSRPMRRASNTS